MIKIYFVTPRFSTFVKQDLEILQDFAEVKFHVFEKASSKNLFYTIYTFIIILFSMFRTNITYVWFADLRAYFAVLIGKLLNKKVIVAVAGYEAACLPEINYGGLLKKGQSKRFKYILDNASHIITSSDFSNQEVLDFHKIMNITRIYPGIEIDADKINADKENWIITVGNSEEIISAVKGLPFFAETTLAFPEYKIKIIGKYVTSVRAKLLEINPKIEFTGYLTAPQLQDLYRKTKIYCQLSLRESFGLSVVEAMQFGCIPVVTNCGALPEVVGDAGFYTEYGEIEKTVLTISKALESGDPEKVKERAIRNFDISIRTAAVKSLIKSVYGN